MPYNPIALSRTADTILSLSPTLWLSSAKFTGYPSGAKIGAWADQSGSNRNAVQNGTSILPTVALSSQNSLPGLVYGAGSSVGHNVWGATGWFSNTVGRTDFIVCKCSSLASSRTVAQTNNYGFIATGSALKTYGGSSLLPVSGFTTNTTALVTHRWNNSTKLNENWRNGSSYSSATAGSAENGADSNESKMTIGGIFNNGNTSAVVTIYEFIHFPVVLSDANKAIVESYLNTKWAIY